MPKEIVLPESARFIEIDAKSNAKGISKQQMTLFEQGFRSSHIKKLSLKNFNNNAGALSPSSNQFFPNTGENNMMLAIRAIALNPNIESLKLDADFMRAFIHEGEYRNISFLWLCNTNLKELILNNSDWDPQVFKSLQNYLMDSRCKVETLEIRGSLDGDQIAALENVMLLSPSLKTYHGTEEDTLQSALDRINNVNFEEYMHRFS